MCGLVGFWEFREKSREYLTNITDAMCKVLTFRGPDSQSSWASPEIGFAVGHNRLSIVDLSPAGAQPMHSANERYVIAYNGEIYNTEAMRADLSFAGVVFQGHSDTEILLEACAKWGVVNTVQRCNGMFAFALWDKLERQLFLVRDRLGIKPLYWGFHRGTLLFGSQTSAFFKHPLWRPAIDQSALSSFFYHNYIPGADSIYCGMQQVKPGTVVKIDLQQQVKIESFWSLEQVILRRPTSPMYEEEALMEQFDALLRDAVKARMVADVPLGAFLSGGIDSSTIVALMQAQSDRPIKTFSIGFHENLFNEAPYAKAIAEHLQTDHHEYYFSSQDAMDLIPQMPLWYDEPFADSSQLPTFLVSKLARGQVVVSLSGDGGDELFAGYTRYLATHHMLSKFSPLPAWGRKAIAHCLRGVKPDYWDRLAYLIPSTKRPTYLSNKMAKLATVLEGSSSQFYQNIIGLWPMQEMVVQDSPYRFELPLAPTQLNHIENMQFVDTLTYLPDDILAKVDRASMAVSLEARVPFLDYRLVEFAWSLPMQYKCRDGHGKWLLKKLLKKYIPQHLVERPKMGFGVPIGNWLTTSLRPWAEDLFSLRKLPEDGLINRRLVLQRWQEHLSGKRNWEASLWGVLMYQAWQNYWF